MATDKQKRIAAATAAAMAIAAPAEGLRRVAYYDPPGILTVCRGHTGPDVLKGKTYSMQECDRFFNDDMRKAVEHVERCVPGLPPNVLAAFSDAVYNMGPTIACDTDNSTAARLLKQGNLPAACEQLPRWDKARIAGVLTSLPGLTKRRALEMDVCLTGDVAA
jgi:GH24 family phage-related lysozyme (muramidase)